MLPKTYTQADLIFLHTALKSCMSNMCMGKTHPFLIKIFFQLGEKLRALETQVLVLCSSLLLLLFKGNLLVSLNICCAFYSTIKHIWRIDKQLQLFFS